MNDLKELMRELADADRSAKPSAEIEAALRVQVWPHRRPWVWAAAAAVLVALGGAWLFQAEEPPSDPQQAAAAEMRPTDFFVLDNGRPLSEIQSGRLMRVTLPASAPARFGLPPLPPGSRIQADVFLSDDGLAQAVRFVY